MRVETGVAPWLLPTKLVLRLTLNISLGLVGYGGDGKKEKIISKQAKKLQVTAIFRR